MIKEASPAAVSGPALWLHSSPRCCRAERCDPAALRAASVGFSERGGQRGQGHCFDLSLPEALQQTVQDSPKPHRFNREHQTLCILINANNISSVVGIKHPS